MILRRVKPHVKRSSLGLKSTFAVEELSADDERPAWFVASLRSADPDLVREDSARLCAGLARVFDLVDEGQRALAIGHSPTNEAAVYGLTGVIVAPLGKGSGVVVVDTGSGYEVLDTA